MDVSVILTCYNHLAYLPDALDSIRHQTHAPLEIIAIDDGSTDGTRDWLAENGRDCRVILNETNLGTYGSLNRALAACRGDAIAILNDDDTWAPRKLEAQIAHLERHPETGLVHTDGGFIGAHGEPLPGTPLGFDFPRTETGDQFLALLYQNKIIASATLVRRACFEEVGEFDPAYFGSGDWDMWLRIAWKYAIGFVDEPLTFYRWHGENASKKLDRIWADDERLRSAIIAMEPEIVARYGPASRGALAHNSACLGTVRQLNGNPAGARRAYLESLRRQPSRFKSALRWLLTWGGRGFFRRFL